MMAFLDQFGDFNQLLNPSIKILRLSLPEIIVGSLVIAAIILITIALSITLYKTKTNFLKNVQTSLLGRYTDLTTEYKKLDALYKKVTSAPARTQLDDKVWHEQETDFIFKLNEQLSLALQRSLVAKHIVENVHNFLNVQSTVLLLFDGDRKKLSIAHALGIEKNIIESFTLAPGEGVAQFVVAQNRPIMIDDLAKDHYFNAMNKEPYLRGNTISVPLLFQKDSLGALHVCNKKNNQPFSQGDFSLLVNIAKVGAIAFKNIILFEQINENYMKTIGALASAIDARDPYTKWHSENVTRYSTAIGKEMKLNYHDQEVLTRAALLHDVGKIGIRDNVLLKTEKLNDEEYEQIKLHAPKGDEIVKSLSFLQESSALIRHHHERYDGKGYPDKLKGHDIEVGARIIAVADTF
ncbi:MAG: HD domain-containing protein, partial [Candidatus Omnitrophica bacterium]|nr:HD domain-containing protein [Candidatus Omnitrophota bacterium]